MFIPPDGPIPARIYIVGEAPGQEESDEGRPFVGSSGYQLNQMLAEAGIRRSDCRVGNVFRLQPFGNDISRFVLDAKGKARELGWIEHNGRFVLPERYPDIAELEEDILLTEPNLIIMAGGTPTWALAGDKNILRRRGNLVEVSIRGRTFKAISTYHPAYILRSWSDRYITIHDLKRAERESHSPGLVHRPEHFIVRPSFGQVMAFVERIEKELVRGPTVFAVDLETRGGHIACCGLALNVIESICIPFMCLERREGYWDFFEELAIVERLQGILSHPNARIVGQNFLYDSQYIWAEWFCTPSVFADTMFMQHTLFPNMRKALDFLVTLYADQPRYWKVEGKEWDPKMPEEQLWTYNCRDCSYTFEVYEEMFDLLQRLDLVSQWSFLQSLFYPVLEMMLRGIKRDPLRQKQFSIELEAATKERLEWLEKVCGHPLNPKSPKQMKEFFYDDLRIKPVYKKRDDGTYGPTVDDDALEKIAGREPLMQPVVDCIRDLRSIGVFRSTFVEMDPSDDGRIRCSFNVTGTYTYRFSSSENAFGSGGNLQNIPRSTNEVAEYVRDHGPQLRAFLVTRFKAADVESAEAEGYILIDEDGVASYRFVLPAVRKMFVPDPNYTLFDIDLQGADAQVVAWEADDPVLKQMFKEKKDVHSENGKVLECLRQMAKVWVHGTNYGGTPTTMARHCGITVHRAEMMQRRWFAEHPGILDWHRRTKEKLLTTRTIENAFGFRCVFFDRPDSVFGEALAWTPQSTVALTINHALRNIHQNCKWAQLLLQVHDSLVGQLPSSMLHRMPELEQQCLIRIPYPDPLIIPVGIKVSDVSWGDAKEWKPC